MGHLLLATEFVSSIAPRVNSIAEKGMAFFVILLQSDEKRDDLFNILWALVFGFATINILSLAVKRFDANKKRMSFGEILAVLVVRSPGIESPNKVPAGRRAWVRSIKQGTQACLLGRMATPPPPSPSDCSGAASSWHRPAIPAVRCAHPSRQPPAAPW